MPTANEQNQKIGTFSRFKRWLYSLGPGIIIAALVFGPSKITITSKLGASYGYTLLWIVVIAIFFMAVFTAISARIGLATNNSLLTTMKEKWGKPVAIAVGVGIFLVTASFQAGNSVGTGIALAEMTHTSPLQWIIIFNVIGIGLLFFKGFYKILEKVMILLVGLMLIAFLITVFVVKPDIKEVATGFVPQVPDNSIGLIIAFTASCFSIVGAFFQSYLVQERRRVSPKLVQKNNSSVTGIIIMGLMSVIVLVCAATVLFPAGIKVNSATDMAKALEPLFGNNASKLFLFGLFGASFSSLIGNAAVGGTLLGDALGYGTQLSSTVVKSLIALVMLIGATVAISFGKLPLELIILAQSITILIVPFIGYAMYAISNDKAIMGKHKNSTAVKIIGFVGLLLLLILAAINVKELFFK